MFSPAADNSSQGDNSSQLVLGDRYQLEHRLGKHAGRQTWLARDVQTNTQVVVKLLTFSRDIAWNDLKLFEREAATLQSLDHPAIPQYLDHFEFETGSSKGVALVQTYIEARSLEADIQAHETFTEKEVRWIVRRLLHILTYLHNRNPPVIHRDIKPANILLVDEETVPSAGESAQPLLYLVDFGSVQTLATKEGKTITVVGTYGYMPPEQFGGIASPVSDLYGVGTTAIALLTGCHPAELPQANLRIEFETLIPVSPAFAAWLQRMTAPSPQERFPSAAVALQALNHLPPPTRSLNPVTTLQLFTYALRRSIYLGTGLGGLYSIVFSLSLTFGMLAPHAFMVGIFSGLILGVFNGLLVALWTRYFYFPLTSPRQHRQSTSFVSMVACTTVSTGILTFIYQVVMRMVELSPFFVIAPAIIMGLVMGRVSRSISLWYEQEHQGDRQLAKIAGTNGIGR